MLREDGSNEPPLAEFEEHPGIPNNWMVIASSRTMEAQLPADRPPILYLPDGIESGVHELRLFELREYYWKLVPETGDEMATVSVTSSLDKSLISRHWINYGGRGRFHYTNYLGSSWIDIKVGGRPATRISFDVTSPKLDYDREYRSMVENIGAECQQLLLEWGTPVSLNIAPNPERTSRTLLEQFLFVRHVLGTDKLELFLELINRRLHTALVRECEWYNSGSVDPRYVAIDPLRRGRGWRRHGSGLQPSEIQIERKYESLDTPPNRFVKFVILKFREICNQVLQLQRGGRPAFEPTDSVSMEAKSLINSLDSVLAQSLFNTVGDLDRIPFESITLQRREGYRDFLTAWLMLDAAAQLDWPGREDVYDGSVRNVAILYEYWIYFLLVRALQNKLGLLPQRDPLTRVDGAVPFCCKTEDGRLNINLKQSETSLTRFKWEKDGARLYVHFFYNRSFGKSSLDKRGSYSKKFRPDYSLVIIPADYDNDDWYEAEQAAEREGRIAYLHFDAKYRGENLSGLFGVAEREEDPFEKSSVDGELRPDQTTANRYDLYKMHTYNEAIRRTIGSYILYPGKALSGESDSHYRRYHEIVPGIGAFALRPTGSDKIPPGLEDVCGFINDILEHQLDRFTQSYKITTSTESVIRDAPITYYLSGGVVETTHLPKATVIMGYMRVGDIERFKSNGIFYCRAVDEDGVPLSLDLSAAQGAILVGWTGPRGGPFITVDWRGHISSCRLLDPNRLSIETGIVPRSKSSHYLLFKIADIQSFGRREVTSLVNEHNRNGEGGMFRTFQTDYHILNEQAYPR